MINQLILSPEGEAFSLGFLWGINNILKIETLPLSATWGLRHVRIVQL